MVKPVYACLLVVAGVAIAASAQQTPALNNDRRTPVVQVFQTAKDAVVNISAQRIISTGGLFGMDDPFEDIFDLPFARRVPVQSLGSGFVIHPSGYLVTNEHVVRRAEEITISLADGSSHKAEVIATDPKHDLAVLKMELPAGKTMPALPLGRSDDLMIGETVIAIGNPLGYQHTVTSGVISATDRKLEFSSDVEYSGLIQTDTSINPGNSGGPLLNINAQVIGINTAIRPDAQGIGFAIPINALADDLPRLLDVGRINRIVVGMKVRQGPAVATRPSDLSVQLEVDQVDAGGPADRAGLRAGMVLLHMNGKPIASMADYFVRLLDHKPGQKVVFLAGDSQRAGRTTAHEVVLDQRPQPDGRALAAKWLGLDAEPLTAERARQLRLPTDKGLLVTRVERSGPAHRVGLQAGDILFQLGQSYVLSLEALGGVLEDVEPGQALRVGIVRGRYRAWATIRAAVAPAIQNGSSAAPV